MEVCYIMYIFKLSVLKFFWNNNYILLKEKNTDFIQIKVLNIS